jgi:hypothetical protein
MRGKGKRKKFPYYLLSKWIPAFACPQASVGAGMTKERDFNTVNV